MHTDTVDVILLRDRLISMQVINYYCFGVHGDRCGAYVKLKAGNETLLITGYERYYMPRCLMIKLRMFMH